MKRIPILNIDQFKQEQALKNFYSNDLTTHFRKNKGLIHIPHKHNFYLCVLFTEGNGIHEIDFNCYDVNPGSVFFLKPGQTHYWKFDKTPKGYIFFHNSDFYNLNFTNSELEQFPFYSSLQNPPHLNLTGNKTQYFKGRFEELHKEYAEDQSYKVLRLTSLLNLIYIDLSRYYSIDTNREITTSSYLKTFQTLEKAIEKNYKTEKSAKFYADILCVSAKHLNRISKTTLNKTTTELITDRVLLESKRLIVHSKNNLAEIAHILGYEDYAYFSKVFKAKVNLTPMQFRKKYQSIK